MDCMGCSKTIESGDLSLLLTMGELLDPIQWSIEIKHQEYWHLTCWPGRKEVKVGPKSVG